MKLLELFESINGKRLVELDASTRQFRTWFGNSKVVDDDGSPMVMYHGTNSFKPFKKLRGMSHFGTMGAAETILQYGTASFEDAYPARMYPVYLKIENPLEIDDSGENHNASEYARASGILLFKTGHIKEALPLLIRVMSAENQSRLLLKRGRKGETTLRSALLTIPVHDRNAAYTKFNEMHEWQKMRFLVKYIERLGYDGFTYENQVEDAGSISWVPFRSSQIRYVYDENITESLDDIYTTMASISKEQTWDNFFDEMRAAWIGGVSDFGNPDAARVIQTHPEYYEYHDQLQQAVTQYLGDPFTAYRLMARDQVEEWQSGSDMPAVAVSLEKRVAVAFRNLAGNKGRDDLILVELTIPAESVIMLGHEGEHELVINPNHISAHEIRPLSESILIEAQLNELKSSQLDELKKVFDQGRFERVDHWLDENGWEQLGEGSFSMAYSNPSSPYVIKFLKEGLSMRDNSENRCQLNWLRYSNKNWMSNPHLPRVYYIKTAREKNWDDAYTGDTGYMVVMERLGKVMNAYQGMDDEKRDTLASLLSHSMAGEPESYMPFIAADPESDENPRDVENRYFDARYRQSRDVHRQQQQSGDFQQLAQTFQMMQDMLRNSGCHSDLHDENIMVRPGTNELVVNDPFIG